MVINNSNGMLIDGIAASEALDTSGEVFEVKGADITSFNDGTAHFNYEHKGHDDVKIQGSEIVGKILSGKKIYKKSDCSNEREEMYWDFCKVPFIYIVGRLYDSAGHQGAGEIAAIIRDAHANDDKVSIGFSIEGSTLERKENRLVTTVCRRVAITLKSCNKTAHLGLLQDPNAPEGFDKEPSKVDIASMVDKAELNGMYTRLGGHTMDYGETTLKTLSAGSYNAAPGSLVGGAALQREDLGKRHKALAMAAYRDWDKKSDFKSMLKSKLPEASDEFIEHFTKLVDNHQIRLTKTEEAIKDLKAAGKTIKTPKAPKADAKPAKVDDRLTVVGQPIPTTRVSAPKFDEKTGVLRTPRGNFSMYIPSRDPNPEMGKAFQGILADPKIEHFHGYATDNWMKLHKLAKAGQLPPEVVMHAVLFSQLSPNTPVPMQELMYCLGAEVILPTVDGNYKRIVDITTSDKVWGINKDGLVVENKVVALHSNGMVEGFEIFFDDGYSVICSANHKFLTKYGQLSIKEIVLFNIEIINVTKSENKWVEKSLWIDSIAQARNLSGRRVVQIRALGKQPMYDLEVDHPEHNFLLPNGIVTSNSHLNDSMKATGKDFRSGNPEDLETIRKDWLKRDQPSAFPATSPEHFARIERLLRNKTDSKTTGRKAGEIGSFMLANNKFKNMSKYHTIQSSINEIIGRHKGDARSAAEELLHHKIQSELWEDKRNRGIKSTGQDIGEYQGPSLPGLAPKTTRYTLGMLGLGNVHVPDTHFVRNLFGLDRNADTKTIEYLKNVMWNPGNSHVLAGIDRYYAQNHDAVKFMLEHPKYGSQFEKPEDAIFPAFWRHWMAILPHEKARGFKVNGFNELTDHKPFWEATAPFTKSEHDETDHLTIRTARQHADWVHQYGEVPAQMLYARWIIPQLLEHGAKRIAPVAIRKFQELSVDLRKGFHMPDSEGPSPTPEPVHTEEASTPPPPPDETHVEFNGKRIIPGVGHYGGDMYHILEAGANHFTVVPHDAMAKIKSPTIDTPTGPMKQPWWGPHDITQIPRHSSPGTGVKETNWDIKSYPQSLDAPTKVDTHIHAVGDYLHHDDVRQMVEGFDFAQPKKWGTEGVQADSSFWGKTPDGKPVYVKRAPIEAQLNGARKEALYYNLSRDFFGLDKYVPKTALVSNPTDGTEWAIVEGHQGVHGDYDRPHPSAAQTLNAHQKTGDLDKLAIMNMISSNPDAHPMNNLYTKDGLKLLDHGHSYQGVPIVKFGWFGRNGYAGYLGDHHHVNGRRSSHDPEFTGFHPEAMSWLHSLDPKLLREHLVRHEVPPRLKENMIARLERLQHLTKMSPNSSRIDLLHGAEYV